MANDFLTLKATEHLRNNSAWLADARTNAPLFQPTICGKFLSRRFGKDPLHVESCVRLALKQLEKEKTNA